MHATPTLFSPFEMRGITARNRIVVSPMSQYAAPDGLPGDWHRVHLGKFALGGAGIVFCEETSVAANARKTTHCPGIYNEAQGLAWRRITDFLRANGALSAMRLGHAGRKVATLPPWEGFAPLPEGQAWRGYSSSPLAFKPGSTGRCSFGRPASTARPAAGVLMTRWCWQGICTSAAWT